MVLVTSFSLERPKFTDRKIKGVRIYKCNITKNKKQNKIVANFDYIQQKQIQIIT